MNNKSNEFFIFNKSSKIIKSKINSKEIIQYQSRLSFPDNPDTRIIFIILKYIIIYTLILIYINFLKEFILYCDINKKRIINNLYQINNIDNKKYLILFISWIFKSAEIRYTSIELKYLSIIWYLHKLKYYIDRSNLKLIIDHLILKWIWNIKNMINSQLFKWNLLLNFLKNKIIIIHRSDHFNNNIDSFSHYFILTYFIILIYITQEWQ